MGQKSSFLCDQKKKTRCKHFLGEGVPTCMRVFKTYLQDLEEAAPRLKSKVLATCNNKHLSILEIMIKKCYESGKPNIIITLFNKQETSLSASFTTSSINLPSGSAVACVNSWQTTFIPSTD